MAFLHNLDSKHVLCSPFSIGRSLNANIIVRNKFVSRNLCVLEEKQNGWNLIVHGTTGVKVNDILIEKDGFVVLTHGDVIQISEAEPIEKWTFSYPNEGYELKISSPYTLVNESQSLFDVCQENENLECRLSHCNDDGVEMESIIHKPSSSLSTKSSIEGDSLCAEERSFQPIELLKEVTENDVKASKLKNTFKMVDLGAIALERNVRKYCQEISTDIKKQLLEKDNTVDESIAICTKHWRSKLIEKLQAEAGNVVANNAEAVDGTSKIEEMQRQLDECQDQIKKLESERAALITRGSPSSVVNKVETIIESEFQCSICSEPFIKAVTLNCTHILCSHCLAVWRKTRPTCPICRAPIISVNRALAVDNFIDKMVDSILSEEYKKNRQSIIEERNKMAVSEKRPRKRKSQSPREFIPNPYIPATLFSLDMEMTVGSPLDLRGSGQPNRRSVRVAAQRPIAVPQPIAAHLPIAARRPMIAQLPRTPQRPVSFLDLFENSSWNNISMPNEVIEID